MLTRHSHQIQVYLYLAVLLVLLVLLGMTTILSNVPIPGAEAKAQNFDRLCP
jgi:heme A synthase